MILRVPDVNVDVTTVQDSAKEIDPVDADHREIGAGLFEEEMAPSSSMARLYRGEIHRMKFWRERLDRTTNWAVLVMSGVLTGGSLGQTAHITSSCWG